MYVYVNVCKDILILCTCVSIAYEYACVIYSCSLRVHMLVYSVYMCKQLQTFKGC